MTFTTWKTNNHTLVTRSFAYPQHNDTIILTKLSTTLKKKNVNQINTYLLLQEIGRVKTCILTQYVKWEIFS